MYGLGENSFLVATAADSSISNMTDAAMATTMQSLEQPIDGECPPCDPVIIYRDKIIYKDKIIEKKVQVPGPTQIIYQSAPPTNGGSQSAPPSGVVESPALKPWYGDDGGIDTNIDPNYFSAEDSEMYEGQVHTALSEKKTPWWIYAVGIGGAYFIFKKKKK